MRSSQLIEVYAAGHGPAPAILSIPFDHVVSGTLRIVSILSHPLAELVEDYQFHLNALEKNIGDGCDIVKGIWEILFQNKIRR